MPQCFLDETLEIIERTQDETGLKIRLEPTEPEYLSRTGLAEFLGQKDPYEITIKYKPSCQSIDYAVAHEAVRIMRFQKAAPEQRYALIMTDAHRKIAYRRMEEDLLEDALGDRVPDLPGLEETIRKGFPIFYERLMTQLFSQPGDWWINQWLLDNYPSFRIEIEAGLREAFVMAHKGLKWEVRMFTPETVHRSSNSMNAAFAGFVSELLGDEKFVKPYRRTIFERLGAKLMGYNLTDRGLPGIRKQRIIGRGSWGWRGGMGGSKGSSEIGARNGYS